MAVGVLRDDSPVIASDNDGRVRGGWRTAPRSPIRWTCLNRHGSSRFMGNITLTAGGWDIAHPPASRSLTYTKLLLVQRPRPTDTTIG
jgi:hypothetical protein